MIVHVTTVASITKSRIAVKIRSEIIFVRDRMQDPDVAVDAFPTGM